MKKPEAVRRGEPRGKLNTTSPLFAAAGYVLAFALGCGTVQLGWHGSSVEEGDRDLDRTTSAVAPSDAHDVWEYTTHPGMAEEGFNWTQLSMSRSGNFPNTFVKHMQAADVEHVHKMAFAIRRCDKLARGFTHRGTVAESATFQARPRRGSRQ